MYVNPCLFLVIFLLFILLFKCKLEKSVDVMFEIRTQCRKMAGELVSTDRWWPLTILVFPVKK